MSYALEMSSLLPGSQIQPSSLITTWWRCRSTKPIGREQRAQPHRSHGPTSPPIFCHLDNYDSRFSHLSTSHSCFSGFHCRACSPRFLSSTCEEALGGVLC